MHTIASTHGLHFAAQVAQVLLTDSGTFRAATRWPGLHCADIVAEQYRGLPGSDSFKFARSASTSKFVLGTIFLEKVQLHDVFRIDCLPSVAGLVHCLRTRCYCSSDKEATEKQQQSQQNALA